MIVALERRPGRRPGHRRDAAARWSRASSTATRTCRSRAGGRRSTSRRSPACRTRRSRARGGGIASRRGRWPRRATTRCSRRRARSRAEMLAHGHDDVRGARPATGSRARASCGSLRLGRAGRRDRVTGLFAHVVPAGYDAAGWMDEVDELAAEADVDALDIYVESVAFRNEDLERLGEIARREGVPLRAHVEQFNANRSVPVALAAGARSVDHLACLHPDDLAPLAAAECAAVLLPGRRVPGRRGAGAGPRAGRRGRDLRAGHRLQPGHLAAAVAAVGDRARGAPLRLDGARGAGRVHAQRRLGAGLRRPRVDRGRQARRPRRARRAGRAHRLPLRPQPGRRGHRRRDRRRPSSRRCSSDLVPIGLDESGGDDAAGLDRRGRAGGRLVRAPRRGDRAQAGARPGRQPVGVPGHAAAVVGGRLAPGQRARRRALRRRARRRRRRSRWPSARRWP